MIKQSRMYICDDRAEWLQLRSGYIGGSDAGCIMGLNPWKSNLDLYREKTGLQEPEDISDKDIVKYGVAAEPHLRALFGLDYPEYRVEYIENNIWYSDFIDWAHASLDGWLTDPEGRKGILEIKTANIQNAAQKEKWQGQIPPSYFCQILHYLMVTGWDFAILSAWLKYEIPGEEPFAQVKRYRIKRKEVEEDIAYLRAEEEKFWECVKNKIEPGRKLPSI